MILISQTYEIVTNESAMDGDAAERGYEWEDVPHTFHELIELLRDHTEPSCWPLYEDQIDEHVWFTQADCDHDRNYFESGEEKTTSVHFSHKNPPSALKYWRWAIKAAGLVKSRNPVTL